jgi:hypothetical protein
MDPCNSLEILCDMLKVRCNFRSCHYATCNLPCGAGFVKFVNVPVSPVSTNAVILTVFTVGLAYGYENGYVYGW